MKAEEAVKLVAEEAGLEVVFMRALPLDREVLSTVMKRMTDGKAADLILTTGGADVIQVTVHQKQP